MLLLAYHYSRVYTKVQCTYTFFDGSAVTQIVANVTDNVSYTIGYDYDFISGVVLNGRENTVLLESFNANVAAKVTYKSQYSYQSIIADDGDWYSF